jgi:hypothetical protein
MTEAKIKIGTSCRSPFTEFHSTSAHLGSARRFQKRRPGFHEVRCRGQAATIDQAFGIRQGLPVEGGHAARESVDKAVEVRIRNGAIDPAISFRGGGIKVISAKDDC